MEKEFELQFKLEEKIMSCWNIVDDLKVLSEAIEDGYTTNETTNILNGLHDLYQAKFSQLQVTFEEYMAALRATRYNPPDCCGQRFADPSESTVTTTRPMPEFFEEIEKQVASQEIPLSLIDDEL